MVEYAHDRGVWVEAELGRLAGVEEHVVSESSIYTDPDQAVEFVERSGCDSLAIAIGTSHGAYKFTPEQCTVDPETGLLVPPPLAFNVLKAIEEKLKPDLDHDLLAGKKDLCELLSIEIVERYYHHKGAIKQSLKNDKTVDKAIETLRNIDEYNKILGNNK